MDDEVGGNTSQKGYGHQGVTLLLCEKDSVKKRATSNQDKHFASLSFTTLATEPLTYCSMIDSIVSNCKVKTGVYMNKEYAGDPDDDVFSKTILERMKYSQAVQAAILESRKCHAL